MQYLNEKGYPFTPYNINLFARMFKANGGSYTRRNYKTIEHNELGVNSHVEQSILSNNVHINSTIDQIVMIFERPMSITDEKAQEIINQMQENS